jgi:hypothetical protein
VFYFSGYRLTVYHWQRNAELGSFSFHPDDEGLNDFRKYLYATEKTPVRLLIDIIEEDFRKEKVPHVNFRDRQAIIERLIDRHYRSNTDYVHYRVTGREAEGRRDDIVRLSVLSNPDLFQKWLAIIDEIDIPLVGVWSLPLLSRELIDYLQPGHENILLVTQQVPSNLRQTFIKKGQIISSRATVINTHNESIGKIIFDEVEQNTRFLTNQRILDFDDRLSVHVLGNNENLAQIQQYCADSGIVSYHFYDNQQISKKAGLHNSDSPLCNDLFAFLCARQWLSRGHYGARRLFASYYQYLTSRTVSLASFVLAVAAVALGVTYISDIFLLRDDIATNTRYAEVLESSYREQMLGIEAELKKTRGMESAVFMYEKIKQHRDVSPQNFMVELSDVFGKASIADAVVTQIAWQGTLDSKLPDDSDRRRKKQQVLYSSARDINHMARVEGYIRVSETGIKQAVDKVNQMIAVLGQHQQVLDVDVVHLPLDVRPESSVINEGGANIDQKEDDRKRGRFEFRVLLRGARS